MPSATHQNFVLLFRNHPELAFELARRSGAPLLCEYETIEEVAAEFDDPVYTGNTVRADLAFLGHHGERRHGLVLEVQLDVDPDKEWSVALYRTALRRKQRCPVWAVVFSPEAKVRDGLHERMFCEEPELRPQVVTPEMIPIVRDLDTAIANYPWAVLAATVHATDPDAVICAGVAIQALLCVAPEDFGRYIQLVAASVGKDVMQQVREQLPSDEREKLSEWERRGSMFTTGFDEGLEQGLEEGLRSALRTVLEARGLILDEDAQEWIAACSDLDELREMIARAATITTVAELRMVGK